jgi:hypothetical protein
LNSSAYTSLNTVGSAFLSFASDMEYPSETYVIIEAEVKRNGSLAIGSLLPTGIIQTVTLALEEQVLERTVLFPVFTMYFLAHGRLFEIMITYLLKHREASQNERPPLILRADVPRLRHIARKRMGYLRATWAIV